MTFDGKNFFELKPGMLLECTSDQGIEELPFFTMGGELKDFTIGKEYTLGPKTSAEDIDNSDVDCYGICGDSGNFQTFSELEVCTWFKPKPS